GYGTKRTPALAARYAQEFNLPFPPLEVYGEYVERMRQACTDSGRDPATLRTTVALVVCCGRDEAEFRRRADAIGREPDELRANGGAVCLEAVATHAALALETERVRCGSLVYSVGYRHPAVLANAMATLDHLAGGRIVLGLGGGWHQGEYDAYGIPFPPVPVRLRMLDEGIQ